MARRSLLAIIMISFAGLAHAQNTSYLKLGLNKAVGLSYKHVSYYSDSDGSRHRAPYSAGGGAGLQLEYGRHITSLISASVFAGYQQILALPTEEENDDILASFHFFTVGANINTIILKTKGIVQEVSVGVGGTSANPGKLRRTEEDLKLKPLNYHNTYGWQLNSNFMLDPFKSEKLKLDTFFGFKNLSYSPGLRKSPEDPGKLNGKGFFIGLGLRTYL